MAPRKGPTSWKHAAGKPAIKRNRKKRATAKAAVKPPSASPNNDAVAAL